MYDQRAGRLDLGRHVREPELDGLEARDRLAELLALLRVRVGEVVGALREADAHRGDRDPAAVEDLEELLEALRRAARAGSPRGRRTSLNESSRVSEALQPSFFIGAEIS